ncbi:MAG: hypothetical protein WAX04_10185 [Oscillospiraceae bacterium]
MVVSDEVSIEDVDFSDFGSGEVTFLDETLKLLFDDVLFSEVIVSDPTS